MARKKIVFVIVEGPSDSEALGVLLEKIYNPNEVYVQVVHGDVTSAKGAEFSTILARIGEIVKGYMNSYHLANNYFQEIVHIVDMDGAFIPDDSVFSDKGTYLETWSFIKQEKHSLERHTNFRICIERALDKQKYLEEEKKGWTVLLALAA